MTLGAPSILFNSNICAIFLNRTSLEATVQIFKLQRIKNAPKDHQFTSIVRIILIRLESGT